LSSKKDAKVLDDCTVKAGVAKVDVGTKFGTAGVEVGADVATDDDLDADIDVVEADAKEEDVCNGVLDVAGVASKEVVVEAEVSEAAVFEVVEIVDVGAGSLAKLSVHWTRPVFESNPHATARV
jgi:hypothetical protein